MCRLGPKHLWSEAFEAHSFTRKAPGGGEYIFDSGPSILTDMGKRNPLRLVLDYVGASEYVEWIHYDGGQA